MISLWIGGGVGLALLASLPWWLPPRVVQLRTWIFTRINGDAALLLPNESLGAAAFRELYANSSLGGRSEGAALSDLFWYWLAPGPEMHQEHLENGPRYRSIAQLSRRILAVPRRDIEALVDRCYETTAALHPPGTKFIRLRDVVMPFWACFWHEIVFREVCPPAQRELIVGHANDVITALKCCGLRHMDRRDALTRSLLDRIERGSLPHEFPPGFTLAEQAFYLQGMFFNTAVVQMSEAMSHVFLTLAQHRETQERMSSSPENRRLYDHAIDEILRLYPLFGIAHRISTSPIDAGGKQIPAGSVVCFNYSEFHQLGFADAGEFRPERWEHCKAKDANFIPFGVTENRPCPAQGIALIAMHRLTERWLRDYRFASSAEHTRSMPNRGPCFIAPRRILPRLGERAWLAGMWVRDRWETVFRSIAQLVFGVMMIREARRLRLCERHFAAHPSHAER
ncbi:MAG: cytochrome P450 [Steroidobacteraceae bacterium]|nr:cytochrome P450 [Steroidobacteraceae bacterium]